jgi:hypothetical protein
MQDSTIVSGLMAAGAAFFLKYEYPIRRKSLEKPVRGC